MTKQNIESPEPFEDRLESILQLSTVVNRFMDIPRATMKEERQETDGEHSLHLQFIAVSYAAKYYPELDTGKVALYALVHDFVEVYAGDTNSLTATPEVIAQKALKERVAFDRLERELGEVWPDFISLIRRYEELEEREARFVKCFDKCDASISHCHDKGKALLKMGITTAEEYGEMAERAQGRITQYSDEFPDIVTLRGMLLVRVAKMTY